jgi:hypothetical protein
MLYQCEPELLDSYMALHRFHSSFYNYTMAKTSRKNVHEPKVQLKFIKCFFILVLIWIEFFKNLKFYSHGQLHICKTSLLNRTFQQTEIQFLPFRKSDNYNKKFAIVWSMIKANFTLSSKLLQSSEFKFEQYIGLCPMVMIP